MTLPLLTDQKESPGVTFAEPGSAEGFATALKRSAFPLSTAALDIARNPELYGDIFTKAERSVRLTGNMVSESAARSEAYENRIKAIKDATGIELENPERGGYAIDARKAIRDEVRAGGLQPIDAKGGIPEYQKRIFDQKVADIQKEHPDLQFGDIQPAAETIAKMAADAAAQPRPEANVIASFATQFAAGAVGSRRDPLFIGSMFAGPTSAVGKTALARIASSSLFTGLFNAGVSAVEQPAVQDWRARIGMESGVIPALHEVGVAFALGLIPGALIQGVKEGLATPLRRVLAGHPEPGDLEAIHAGLTPAAPREAAALASGAESVAADRATLTIPEPKGIEPQLHDDMLAAALKRADDPAEPSPEAVQAVRAIEQQPPPGESANRVGETNVGFGSAAMKAYREMLRSGELDEVAQRVRDWQPKSEREAVEAADQALDDIGRRESAAVLRESIDRLAAERETARAERLAAEAIEPAPKIPSKDPIGKIPWVDDEGRPKLLTAKAAAAVGERDDLFAMLVRSCK